MSLPRILGLALAGPAVLTLAGCANGSTPVRGAETAPPPAGHISCRIPDGSLGIAASARANDPAPEVTPSVAAVLKHAVDKQEYVAIFDTDGSPSKVGDLRLSSRAANPRARAEEISAQVNQLTNGLLRSQANAPEAEPLGALDQAARSVHAQGSHGTVVLMDSGLQTTGALQYQSEGLLLASGQDLVAYLRSTGELPDLRGLTVVLSGLGDTGLPQDRLDIATRNRLVEQWSAIVKAGGATCVHVDSQPLTEPAAAGLPHVTTVAVPKPARPKLDLRRPVALREDSVGFEDNSAELRDAALARQDLKAIAEQIIRGHHYVSLVGTTATAGTEQGRRTLSRQRAETVKRLLVSLGVQAGHISTRGVGTHYPAHVRDLDSHGNLIPEAAVRNRAVFLAVKN